MRLHDYIPAAHDTRDLFTSQGMEDDLAIKLALVSEPTVAMGHEAANEEVARIQARKAATQRRLAEVADHALAGDLEFADDPHANPYLH